MYVQRNTLPTKQQTMEQPKKDAPNKKLTMESHNKFGSKKQTKHGTTPQQMEVWIGLKEHDYPSEQLKGHSRLEGPTAKTMCKNVAKKYVLYVYMYIQYINIIIYVHITTYSVWSKKEPAQLGHIPFPLSALLVARTKVTLQEPQQTKAPKAITTPKE